MNIGIVGPKLRMQKIREVAENFFPDINLVFYHDEYPYSIEQIKAQLAACPGKVDGVIFSGEIPYVIYHQDVPPEIPTDYIQKDWSSLQNALLVASTKGLPFRNVSIDSYSNATVQIVLNDLGIKADHHDIKVIARRHFGPSFYDDIILQHRELYESGAVKGCISAFSYVYRKLDEAGIPCVFHQPTTEVISRTFEKMRRAIDENQGSNGSIAILVIELIPKKEYSTIRRDEYLHMHEKAKVSEEVYYFARNTNGSVVSDSLDRYMVLMNRKDLIEYTNNLQKCYMMNGIKSNTRFDVKIGIGYGYTPSEAKFNAHLALEKHTPETINMAFVVMGSGMTAGPLDFLAHADEKQELAEESVIMALSQECGISKNVLWNLYMILEKTKRYAYSASDIARVLGISQRNANRLLRKMEENGIARIVDKKSTGKPGRPCDVYEIKLPIMG